MSFSVPRCSKPICGSTRSTTSPSSSSTRRNTPCAAGCCGPKLIVKVRLSSAAPGEIAECLRQLHRLVDNALLLGIVADFDVAAQREILAERETLEAVIGEDAAQ